MRIAVISTPFVSVPPARYGGTELVVAALVDGLVQRGHDVVLYATGDSRARAEVRSFYPTPVWPPNPYRELAHAARTLYELFADGTVDVVHAHTAPALVFARLLDVPMVYTIHHDRDAGLEDLYQATCGSSVHMVAISDRQRELFAHACPASVVHHGLDPNGYTLGAGDQGYVAFLGRFAREKGVHVAMDVATAAGVPLRLAGRPHPPDADYFRRRVAPRLRRRGVAWIGEVSHQPKLALLGGALAALMPLGWDEPFGLVMLEAMLCGTPVLAFPRGAAPEIVEDGVTGWLCDGADDMARRLAALASGALPFDRARCRARAAERFSQDLMVDRYVAIYERAVAGAHPATTRSLSLATPMAPQITTP